MKKEKTASYSLEELSKMLLDKGMKIHPKKPLSKMSKNELIREVEMLEKLIELNMEDLWKIVDQRDELYKELDLLKQSKEK
jgi:hypothetical protein